MVSDEMDSDKSGKTVTKSRLHPGTAQEKYHYKTGKLQITNRGTPAH